MPAIVDHVTISNKSLDKRVKLTDNDRLIIRSLSKETSASQRQLAYAFGVSRRTITFIIDPEKQKNNYDRRVERGGSKQYYDKDQNTASMKKHRDYKRDLLDKGLIQFQA